MTELPLSKITAPVQVVGLDHLGPLPRTKTGYTLILVWVDYLSRFLWAIPVKSASALDAASCLEDWMDESGLVPTLLYPDAGGAFTSAEFALKMDKRGVQVQPAPAKAHKSVGMVETHIRILLDVITKSILSRKYEADEWDVNLPRELLKVNTRFIQSLLFTPYEILYGFMPQPPVFAAGSFKVGAEWTPPPESELDEAAIWYVARMEGVRREVADRMSVTAAAQAARHDQRAYQPFRAGDLVMVVQEGKQPKLEPRWRGPFAVKARVGRASYVLEQLDGTPIAHARH
ncbi:hypothetical protein GCG54_00015285 [Colletotrichum gloeosporioides]|uniref:Integrase catalytic domain-containing protein n=1 Tax=Colletotrichum gloeosporioides TaxID=474922 RepID=A0A8H4FDD9_COLGL|nr:uncharacterized protein GCG54_00015285 [Colletotrichum gloeosporioides]KAF3798303.1 hypothetical protein GCG54_00015285 [Colletotrichum gloeosporioides]